MIRAFDFKARKMKNYLFILAQMKSQYTFVGVVYEFVEVGRFLAVVPFDWN